MPVINERIIFVCANIEDDVSENSMYEVRDEENNELSYNIWFKLSNFLMIWKSLLVMHLKDLCMRYKMRRQSRKLKRIF